LTAEKKSGKAALNTFAELAAFFKKEEPKPEPPAEQPKPQSETVAEASPQLESKPTPAPEEQKSSEDRSSE
jgi:hypothetical protein